jgi:hypothetical protein
MATILGNPLSLGGGGANGLNIAYGLTPPADTSKLWVRIADKPNSVTVQAVIPFGNEAVTAYGVSIPNDTGAQGLTYCNGLLYIFSRLDMYVYENGSWSKFLTFSSDTTRVHYTAPSVVIGKKIFRLFGHSNGSAMGSSSSSSYNVTRILVIDTETKTYSDVSVPSITSCCQLGNAVVVGKKIYFTAGQKGASGVSGYAGSSHIYEIDSDDPSTATNIGYLFTTSADMRGTSVVAAGGKLYARHGGSAAEGSVPYIDWMEIFDLETKVLTRNQVSISKGGQGSCFMPGINIGKYIYWFGGMPKGTVPVSLITSYQTNYAQRYNIETGEFDFVTVGEHAGVYTNSVMLTNSELLFAKYGGNAPLYKFKGAYELENGKLFIQEGFLDNTWNAVKGKDWDLKVGVNGVFLGGTDGYAQAKDAYLYDLTQQKWISLDGTPFGGVTPEPTPTPTLEGTWVLNERLYAPESTINQTIQFTAKESPTATAQEYASFYSDTSALKFTRATGSTTTVYTYSSNTWNTKYKYLTFPAGATGTDEFRAWLASNATKQ